MLERPTAAVMAAVAVVSVAACGGVADSKSADPPGAPEVGMPCQQQGSFAGRLTVGQGGTGVTTVEPAAPAEPDRAPRPVNLPALESIDIVPSDSSDRVVYTVGGDGVITWSARFVTLPLVRGTDASVPVSGICTVQFDLLNVESGSGPEQQQSSQRRVVADDASSVVEVLSYPSVDGVAQSFVGTRNPLPSLSTESSDEKGTITVTFGS